MSFANSGGIAPPAAFPTPIITTALVKRQNIFLDDGRIIEATVLGPDTISTTREGNFYEITRVIRSAIFGQVHHAVRLHHHETEPNSFRRYVEPLQEFAIKVFNRSKLRELAGTTQENPLNEIAAMQFMSSGGGHINVMNQVECCMDSENVFSIMDYCGGGELYDLLDEIGGPMDEAEARHYFLQITRGLLHIHSFGIGHRDLSLENILVTSGDGCCKIIDFGMCLRMVSAGDDSMDFSTSFSTHRAASSYHNTQYPYLLTPPQGVCGKKNYIAPEVLVNSDPFNPMLADMWAAGCILFILLTGYPPFEFAMEVDQRFRLVKRGHLDQLLQSWGASISPLAIDLLGSLLRADPRERLTAGMVLEHPWVVG